MSQIIRKNDLEFILSGAAALQARMLGHEAIQDLRGIAEAETDEVPIDAVYELAEDVLRIPREYVDSYLQTRFPSRERQIATLSELGARPTHDALKKIYSGEITDVLKIASPSENFTSIQNGYYTLNFQRVVTSNKPVMRRKGIFRKRVIEEEVIVEGIYKLAKITFNLPKGGSFDLHIEDPFFAEVCKDKLAELKERFAPWSSYDINFDYSV